MASLPLPISCGPVLRSMKCPIFNITFAMKRSMAGFAGSFESKRNRSKATTGGCDLAVLDRSSDFVGTNVIGVGLWPGLVTM